MAVAFRLVRFRYPLAREYIVNFPDGDNVIAVRLKRIENRFLERLNRVVAAIRGPGEIVLFSPTKGRAIIRPTVQAGSSSVIFRAIPQTRRSSSGQLLVSGDLQDGVG